MSSYVAFLRGMNLGRRRIRNDELCACFKAMGFTGVSAFLASGNVIFHVARGTHKTLQRRIETELKKALTYDVPTFVRSAVEVSTIAAQQPFTPAQLGRSTGKVQVALLRAPTGAAAAREALALSGDDRLAFHGNEMYWLPIGNLSDSDLEMKALVGILGPMTIRTHRTMTRLERKLTKAE